MRVIKILFYSAIKNSETRIKFPVVIGKPNIFHPRKIKFKSRKPRKLKITTTIYNLKKKK